MSKTDKPAKRAALIGALALGMLSSGCSEPYLGPSEPVPIAQQAPVQTLLADAKVVAIAANESGTAPIQLVAAEEPAPAQLKITLPMAIEMCINNNFRILASAESIRMAQADLITASLIPNPNLFADCQLIPLQHTDIHDQLGPPQWDTLVSFPIDWFLFGKRLAAMRAARLGIEVGNADFADTLRVQLSKTIDAFYEVLEDEAYFKLSEKYLAELEDLEKVTEQMAKDKKVGPLDMDRIKLAVHEAILERHDRELALDLAKAKLRPFLGRTAADPDYEVEGSLTVTATLPPPKLEEAIALAEANRPDLISGRRSIDQTNANVELERRRAKPQVSVQPGWSYYDQVHMNGDRNGSMLDIGISTSLPITDRNQGNIRKARARRQNDSSLTRVIGPTLWPRWSPASPIIPTRSSI